MVSSFLRDRSVVIEVDEVKFTPHFLCISSSLFFLSLSMICVRVFVFQKFISNADDLQIYLSEDIKHFCT
jgi:hypothetical protein